jgi:hypothetical protein
VPDFFLRSIELGMEAHACNPATQEEELGGLQFKASLGINKLSRPPNKSSAIQDMQEEYVGGSQSGAGPGKSLRLYLKNN